ncbi:MAG TPA: hypothetical protein VG734_20090 [Lacunisphaera sp.]|nr:hypothetical protein [Lacunisphaera sp.]
MPIFTRILDLKRAFLARLRNKRTHPRHRVGTSFPLRASLVLVGSSKVSAEEAAARGLRWSGVAGDISAGGLSVLLSPAATTVRGEKSSVQLTLEDLDLAIPCIVAHFRVHSSYAICGLQLKFDDFKVQKAYQQIVEAVAIGASFVAKGPARNQAGFLRRSWKSGGKAQLTEWREAGGTLDRFELSIGEHRVIGRKNQLGLEVQARGQRTKRLSLKAELEVRQLFRWVSGNLPKGVPSDLRELMAKVDRPTSAPGVPAAAAPPPAPVAASASTQNTPSTPAPAWEAPRIKPAPAG